LMDDPEKVYRAARKTMERKGFIEGVLRERGYTVIGGYANSFLLQLRPSDVTRLEQFARSRGILVRCRGEQFLRVSMGTEAEMELFLDTLTEFEKCGVLKS
jgi:histidinol-phosphate/aromatic aminotransferase/cobyric acid decarboxylase-like protein